MTFPPQDIAQEVVEEGRAIAGSIELVAMVQGGDEGRLGRETLMMVFEVVPCSRWLLIRYTVSLRFVEFIKPSVHAIVAIWWLLMARFTFRFVLNQTTGWQGKGAQTKQGQDV